MSIHVMSEVWRNGPDKQGHLLVMLALADYANDDGECWPAIASIAKKARMTERGVQKIVRQLEDDGWLKIVTGNGRGGSNRYTLNPERYSVNSVRGERHSVNTDAKTPNVDAETLNGGSPEPSRTINEPPEKNEAREIRAILCQSASDAAVTSFIAYRRKQKGKALTVTAATRLANQLSEIFERGGDTADALGMAEERGWLTVQPDWYFKAKGQTHERNHHNARPSQGRQNRPDPALEQIARLAGIGSTPGYGGR